MEILFIIIIIGILSSIFGKGQTKNKQNHRNRPVSLETFEEIKTFMQNETKKRTKTIQNEFEQLQPAKKDVIEQYKQVNQNIEARERVQSRPRNKVKEEIVEDKEPLYTELTEEGSRHRDNLETNMILNGIIWSEILGEPRSKNPHFTRRR
ncbi:hypothetical protein [Neobacillus kokaensis]|uniref:Uncharacterized protein n=1 Tax=Neobacillus kokaensis TaxID=2759023 RepID=A0ABQ3MXT4_9BACI|nr:hypothetical protein [Neobacillus kokaensis]GHH97044.1 hypothetical protein AM1BK_05870 [Neobacillus kokaensis]